MDRTPIANRFDESFDSLSNSRQVAEDLRNQLIQKVVELNDARRELSGVQKEALAADLEATKYKKLNNQKRDMLLKLMLERDELLARKKNLTIQVDRNEMQIQDAKNALEDMNSEE